MAGSFSQELEDLLNPQPKFVDPEDDGDEATKAKVIDRFEEEEEVDDEDGVGLSSLRKNNTFLLSDTDKRYVGKAVTRKQLLQDIKGSGDDDEEEEVEEEEDEDDDNEEERSIEEDESVGDEEQDDDDDDDDDEEEEEEEEEEDTQDAKLVSKMKSAEMTFPKGVDFHKLTEGMDDLGVSEDDDDGSGEEMEGSEEDDASDDDDNDEEEDGKEEDGTIRTFSQDKIDEEVEKGKAVKNQLGLWDQLLEGRIKIQKALGTANQLPQPSTFPEFKRRGRAELAGGLKNTHKALKALQRSLLELQDHLLYQNAETRTIATGETGVQGKDEEINSDDDEVEEAPAQGGGAPKRKLEMAEYPDFMAKRFADFQSYQNNTLQKWHDKTRLTMGKSSKGFGAFERNILTQVEQVLMDKERLLRRTQTRRSEYRVLGKKEAAAVTSEAFREGKEDEQHLRANTHLKDLDEDIFDDDDFYHQLLRELIERKTSAADPNDQVAMGRQWLAIQKLRSKIKKKVDTKASKGRKVRFQIHSKLVNFMGPIDHSSMSDEARNELFRGLFGQNSTARE